MVHFIHEVWWRFAHLAEEGKAEFRACQFGLNLGRTQEILGSVGGVNAWWRTFEPLICCGDYKKIIETTREYLCILELPEPDEKFINRI
jgi:hypothetical protein